VAALTVAGALGFCQLKPPSPRVSGQSLWIGTVERGPMLVEIRGAGTLVPEQVEWLPAPADGRVATIAAQPGQTITPDTILIALTNPEVVQAALEAELAVRAAEAELRSRRVGLRSQILTQEALVASVNADHEDARNHAKADLELASAGLASRLTVQASSGREKQLAVRRDVEEKRLAMSRENEQTDLDAWEARLAQLVANLALRRQQRDSLEVHAGRTGVLQEVAVEVGERVSAGANLARVAAPEPLKAVVQISQVDASQIAPGQRVRVDTHHGIVDGTVSRIDPGVQNGSVTVDVRLPGSLPRGVRPDLSVEAAIEIERIDSAVYVKRPVQAAANTSIHVYRLSPDGRSATRIPVRIGRTSFNVVEIMSGLEPGDRIVLSDTSAFESHDHITITD
jgi:HlyD family secretion protein